MTESASGPGEATTVQPPDEQRLLAALRGGDEAAFAALVDRHGGSMLRVAMTWVSTRAVAEEVVQETWLGVLNGLDRFEGRSSLKTWIFRILSNTAKKRAVREGRSIPVSSFLEPGDERDEPTVDPRRFAGPEARYPGGWTLPPRSWDRVPEDQLLSAETLARVRVAIDSLPPVQRQVIAMRDVEGLSSAEVCNVLELSETNQRVILHRARGRVRRALERYLGRGEDGPGGLAATPGVET
ncbi:MAG: sigma-70 family RNA polymerase sigma factor [Actinomycetota bacterium]|nr:sigma-70 family RNA polymerase sigma factor [Actinomycetota bacterium]